MKHLLLTLPLFWAGLAQAETAIIYQAWGSPREGEVWNQIARAFEEHANILEKDAI